MRIVLQSVEGRERVFAALDHDRGRCVPHVQTSDGVCVTRVVALRGTSGERDPKKEIDGIASRVGL